MKKPRIYISGPISGHDIEHRYKVFEAYEANLYLNGYEPVNPMKNGLSADATTNEHMKRDLELLRTCDVIYMMKGWNHSAGCWTEFHDALAIGLEVIFEQIGTSIKFE